MQKLISEQFGENLQHDTCEALEIILENLHRETRLDCKACESQKSLAVAAGVVVGPGVYECSPIYGRFRGWMEVVGSRTQREMFLSLRVAPKGKKPLAELLQESYSGRVSRLPSVLLVEIARHSADGRQIMSQTGVGFDEVIDLSDLLISKEKEESTPLYRLQSVIVRSGLYSHTGHYWTIQKSPLQTWNLINDEVLTKIELEGIRAISSELDAEHNCCLLVYVVDSAAKRR